MNPTIEHKGKTASLECKSYDRAIEMERAGAYVLELKPEMFANN